MRLPAVLLREKAVALRALSKRFRKCGESEIRQPNPGYRHPRPAVLLKNSGGGDRRFPIFLALP